MWWWLAAALAQDCERVSLGELVSVPAPAVIVLGERHGMQPDLGRAMRVVRKLAAQGARVTVALEAVHERYQPVLDRYAEGRVGADDLPDMLDWDSSWGFAWAPYAPLVRAHDVGATVVAAGLTLGPRPEGEAVPLPPSYMDILGPAMGGHPLQPGEEGRFVQAMAWRDHRIAELALQGWDQRSYLVIVTGRGHVEGGKGVTWQLARMTQAPVSSVVLAKGPDAPCYPGDRIWRGL